ncbi:hypothetical protein OS175_12515 [Marinicella sp. S1101]|uniref:hypothetical protein n=1 Tax=Marinicella marina TaxID=2996016 RepID=UPI002260E6C3|nr:hypothetical protein [Marinicella marina]MCX7554705.1 hypothetical protein [Marinicella marina]MDJ1141479.1 hypothetical protein [Marinicella marina]
MNIISKIKIPVIGLTMLFTVNQTMAQTLTKEGPSPFAGGQSEADNDNQVGAVNAIAAHPSNPDIIYIGTVNGGVWKTTNATVNTSNPSWTSLTDFQASLSIQSLEFDPTDQTSETLVAGIGRVSSYGRLGGARTGLLRTTDGGANWTALTALTGLNIAGIAPRGSVIVAAVDNDDFGFNCNSTGIFRSTDTGATFNQVTNGISGGSVDALASDPSDDSILYASIVRATSDCGGTTGIYKSTDTGTSWTKISDAAIDSELVDSTGTHVEIAVGENNNVFIGIAANGSHSGMFYSADGGANFTAMDLPGTMEPDDFFGIHPGGQASIHMSMVADPNNDTLVYIGGDRQPSDNNDGSTGGFSFPNSIGAQTFSGRLFRGDASAESGSQWQPLTHVGTANNTSAHADSRDMMFAANGNLLESDDGGIYVRTSPEDNTGDWFSLNGDLQNTEVHSADYDSNADILGGGAQDNSQGSQIISGVPVWDVLLGGDGGDFDVDVDTLSGKGQSIRYTSAQNLGGFVQVIYNADNSFAGFSFPALTVVSGDDNPIPQFVQPVAINSENPSRIVFGFSNREIDGDNDGDDGGLYESFDQGTTISQLSPNGIQAFAFGPTSIVAGAPGNEEQLYVAADTDLYRRTTAGQDLVSVFSSADLLVGVSQHTVNADEAAIVELFGGVHITDDGGDNWTDVSGNLDTFNPGRLWTVARVANPFGGDDALLVGGDRGLFIADEASGYTQWSILTTDLPNALVIGLNYNPANNELFINTIGRGTLSYENLFDGNDLIFADGFDG